MLFLLYLLRPGQAECHSRNHKLKYVKGVSCHSIVLCQTCNKCQKCCPKSTCRDQTSKLLANLAGSGCRSKAHKVSRGHKLLCKSPQEGIASAYSQKCCRTGKSSNISGVFQPTISSPKAQQQVEAHTRFEQTESSSRRRNSKWRHQKPSERPSNKGSGSPQ